MRVIYSRSINTQTPFKFVILSETHSSHSLLPSEAGDLQNRPKASASALSRRQRAGGKPAKKVVKMAFLRALIDSSEPRTWGFICLPPSNATQVTIRCATPPPKKNRPRVAKVQPSFLPEWGTFGAGSRSGSPAGKCPRNLLPLVPPMPAHLQPGSGHAHHPPGGARADPAGPKGGLQQARVPRTRSPGLGAGLRIARGGGRRGFRGFALDNPSRAGISQPPSRRLHGAPGPGWAGAAEGRADLSPHGAAAGKVAAVPARGAHRVRASLAP